MQAQKSLSSISNNRDLWIAQFRQDVYETDLISSLHAARKEGLKAGQQDGRIALARKYMAMGHTAEEAAAFAEIDVKLLRG